MTTDNMSHWLPLIAEQVSMDGEAEGKDGSHLRKGKRRGGSHAGCRDTRENPSARKVPAGAVPAQPCFKCSSCDETFTQKISLNVHLMFKHGAPRRYQCDKCDYEGPRLYHLKRHMKVHSDERQFVCQECGKGLKTAQAYRNHMVLHTNVGRFACGICSKAFNQKSLYEDHMRSHQGERNFECTYCDAAFKTYKHVACHIRAVHLNDKRFICDVCGAQHMTGANLKAHMKKHKDIDALPYAFHCTSCKAAFRGAEGLSVHMRIMHKVLLSADDEAPEVTFLTLHPTRRPMKIQYGVSGGDAHPDDPEPLPPEGEDATVLVEGENFTIIKAKTSDILYEV